MRCFPDWRTWINPIPLAAIGLIGLFGWLTIFGDQGLLMWGRLTRTQAALAAEETTLTAKLQETTVEAERLKDPRALEPIIRKELGYVRPGELVFQFPEGE